MSEQSFENVKYLDSPTPKQLFNLASIGLSAAAADNLIKRLPRSRREHFWINDLQKNNPDRLDGAESYVRHRMAGRIGKEFVVALESGQIEYEALKRSWKLTLFDVYWVAKEGEKEEGSRVIYQFAWDRNETITSRRFITLKSDNIYNSELDLGDEILNFHLPEDFIPILHAQNEIERVTASDCNELIEDLTEYYSQIRTEHVS